MELSSYKICYNYRYNIKLINENSILAVTICPNENNYYSPSSINRCLETDNN